MSLFRLFHFFLQVVSFFFLDRRDTSRLLGDGVNFKAKLIGVRDVPQARGEKMAQETLQELKVCQKFVLAF